MLQNLNYRSELLQNLNYRGDTPSSSLNYWHRFKLYGGEIIQAKMGMNGRVGIGLVLLLRQ